MNYKEYKKKENNLFKKWKQARPDYEGNGKRFTIDGIADYDAWKIATPKILFLLKENHAAPDDFEPCWGLEHFANSFSKNIACWRHAIIELFIDVSKEITFDCINFERPINDIALVEVKKLNERTTASNPEDILNYAKQDKDFLKEQIELINPQIVFCCGTYYSYQIIFDWEAKNACINKNYFVDEENNIDSSFWFHNNRLIIYFYHPTTMGRSPKKIFELLIRMLKEGNCLRNIT